MKLIHYILLPLAVNTIFGAVKHTLLYMEGVLYNVSIIRVAVFILAIILAVCASRYKLAQTASLIIYVIAIIASIYAFIVAIDIFSYIRLTMSLLYFMAFSFAIYVQFNKQSDA